MPSASVSITVRTVLSTGVNISALNWYNPYSALNWYKPYSALNYGISFTYYELNTY